MPGSKVTADRICCMSGWAGAAPLGMEACALPPARKGGSGGREGGSRVVEGGGPGGGGGGGGGGSAPQWTATKGGNAVVECGRSGISGVVGAWGVGQGGLGETAFLGSVQGSGQGDTLRGWASGSGSAVGKREGAACWGHWPPTVATVMTVATVGGE